MPLYRKDKTTGGETHAALPDLATSLHPNDHAQLHAAAHAESGADEIVDDDQGPSTQAFGDSAAVGADTSKAAPVLHKHGMPANPVPDHEAAADPHTGYRLEGADHSHQTSGLQGGTLDHGLALTGLSDDDHPQYATNTEFDDHNGRHEPGGADAMAVDAAAATGSLRTLGSGAAQAAAGDHSHVGGVLVKSVEVDFGATPVAESEFTITDADVTASSKIVGVIVSYDAPTGKDLDELEMDGLELKAGQAAAGSFKIYARGRDGYVHDKFKLAYVVG